MHTLTLNKQKYKPNPFFGALGAILMTPALVLTLVAMVIIVALIIPGFLVAMVGATKLN